jgi:phosphoglycolate phosphatase
MRRLFFDLDGTLTDSREGIVGSIRYAFERMGRSCPPEAELIPFIGPPLRDTFELLLGEASASPALQFYRERFVEFGWRENRPYDGIEDVLAELQARGITLYVATSKPLVFAERILKHFGLARYFAGVFGAELDGTRGDKRDLLHYAMQLTGTGADATMIGDRRFDVLGGRANGMRTIGVTWGFGSRQELEAAGADRIVDAPSDLRDALVD